MPGQGRASQDFVIVKEIRDGVLIMKDNSLRAIIMTSSVNFSLKSTEEQEATIFQFQNFLNSLDFPLEITILSRKLYIDDYIGTLKEKERLQKNDLLRMQTTEYIQFIQTFVEMQNIMSKFFYVVVPFYISEKKKQSLLTSLTSVFNKAPKKTEKEAMEDNFAVLKEQLWQRVENVMDGLRSFGIKSVILKNDELMELFFALYNPGEEQKKKK
jgi:type IV secretory pathway VirB4 component